MAALPKLRRPTAGPTIAQPATCACGVRWPSFWIKPAWLCRGCWAIHPDNDLWRRERMNAVRRLTEVGDDQ